MRDFGGRTESLSIKHLLDCIEVHNYAFSKGEERKGTLPLIGECPRPILALLFFLNFHIHWFDKQIIVMHAKVGMV